MKCQKCRSERIANISGKTSDCNNGFIEGKDFDGYVPNDIGIGGGDYIKIEWCLDCGQIQGEWPVHPDLDEYDE
jgi:hypothetical protein